MERTTERQRPVPGLYWPDPVLRHPMTEEVDASANAFLNHYRIFMDERHRDRLISGRCGGGLAGLMYPEGPAELLQIVADQCIAIFSFDDFCHDEGPLRNDPAGAARACARVHRAIEVTESFIASNDEIDNYARAFRDLRIRFEDYATPAQMSLWIDGFKDWFAIETHKLCNRAQGVRPSLNDATYLRMHSGGTLPLVDTVQIMSQVDTPPSFFSDRRLLVIREMGCLLLDWASDLYSYHKEMHRSDVVHNLVGVTMNTYRWGYEDALRWNVDMFGRCVSRFTELRNEILQTTADPSVIRYLTAMSWYIGGGIAWCRDNKRYRFVEAIDDGSTPFDADDLLATGAYSSDPPPIPWIAWWWQVGQ